MRDITKFEQNTPVDVEVFEDGFTVRKAMPDKKSFSFPLKEKDLLDELTAEKAHADELVEKIVNESID